MTEHDALLPAQPKCVQDTGLALQLLVELVAKSLFVAGKTHLPVLTNQLHLSINVLREVLEAMSADHSVEVAWRGESDIDVQYQLTAAGRERAAGYLARQRYVGPAPVSLAAYRAMVERQSLRHRQQGVHAADVAAAFDEDVLAPTVRAQLGAAMHAGRSILLHGPSGSGKTSLAHKLARLQPGLIALPHAILIEQQIVQFYDPSVHLAPTPLQLRQGEDRRGLDARWLLCRRPVVQTGTELTASMLELRMDAAGVAALPPLPLLANGGLLIVDDLGRQRISTEDLLNRWSGALDSGADQCGMPCDASLVFCTNLPLEGLLDASFLRRIAFKIALGPLPEASYRTLFRQQCRIQRIIFDEAALDYLIARLYRASGQALLASGPRELLLRIADFAAYEERPARVSISALDQAWTSLYSGAVPEHALESADNTALFERIA